MVDGHREVLKVEMGSIGSTDQLLSLSQVLEIENNSQFSMLKVGHREVM